MDSLTLEPAPAQGSGWIVWPADVRCAPLIRALAWFHGAEGSTALQFFANTHAAEEQGQGPVWAAGRWPLAEGEQEADPLP